MTEPATEDLTRRLQRTTLVSLVVGYAGYYFCRSNFSVASPLLLDAFGSEGLDKEVLGAIASVGVLFYALGKLFNGILCDFVGGKRVFLFGMFASVAATLFLWPGHRGRCFFRSLVHQQAGPIDGMGRPG